MDLQTDWLALHSPCTSSFFTEIGFSIGTISLLKDLQARGGVDPEKTQAVGYAVDELEKIRRKPNLVPPQLEMEKAFTGRD